MEDNDAYDQQSNSNDDNQPGRSGYNTFHISRSSNEPLEYFVKLDLTRSEITHDTQDSVNGNWLVNDIIDHRTVR